ncbi:Zn-ribbon domain-containing OB-fold protein [Sphingosinicella sp. LHD-64]|uniref:Zn-ribbon domain-containing OB-fold protein n=1 Tax=Sphingosinicella sp. LHD-64 TaxID=3072139 RepID=UPI00280DA681|nr:Zn-ribbon domain-containing OB-fold protein [Sphingosinicella sp. LHD-64]MDQ8757580.1 Zn-ribbon domain-containing OB-fold protein [Sphingosinicella sp. LHD-64]
MSERKVPAPELNPEIEAYFAAADEGRLLIKACTNCGEAFHYPRALCPFCRSERTEWREASGKGEIYSFTVLRRAPIPYAVASVQLAEGPRMITNIVDCDFDSLRCGLPVRVVFKPSESGPAVPMFTPEGEPA